jgi:hypothetical protein
MFQVFHLSSNICYKVISERFKSRSDVASSFSPSTVSSRCLLLLAPAGHPPPPPGDVRGGMGPCGHALASGRPVCPDVRALANLITKSRKIRPGVAQVLCGRLSSQDANITFLDQQSMWFIFVLSIKKITYPIFEITSEHVCVLQVTVRHIICCTVLVPMITSLLFSFFL